jgi:SWI/SNF-related matrix-associated actin-dependent regulator 1 of chromatin subfamily A
MSKSNSVTIISYDLAVKLVEQIKQINFQIIISDEAHALKSSTTQRTKLIVPLMKKAKRSIALSGTPALNR